MINIILDDELHIKEAIKFARNDEIDKALFMLRNIDDYHAQINKVVLLFKQYEFSSAREMFWQVLQKYALTHTVMQDLEYVLGEVFDFFSEKEMYGYIPKNKLITADKTLLIQLQQSDVEMFSLDPEEEDIINWLQEDSQQSTFYDTKSCEYYIFLNNKAESYHNKRQFDKEYNVVQTMLDYSGDEPDILQLILISCLRENNHNEQALAIALRLDGRENLTYECQFALAKCFAGFAKYKHMAIKYLSILNDNVDNLPWVLVVDCMTLSNNTLADEQFALNFARYICTHKHLATLSLLKACIYVFFNFGKLSEASSIAKHILCINNTDFVANIVVNYCAKHKDCKKSTLITPIPKFMHNTLPHKIMAEIKNSLINLENSEIRPIKGTKKNIDNLFIYLQYLQSIMYENKKEYNQAISMSLNIMQAFSLQRNTMYYFAKQCKKYIVSEDADVFISTVALRWLYNINTNSKFLVRTTKSAPYIFNAKLLNQCQEDNDKAITMCFLAIIMPLDDNLMKNIVKSYDAIMDGANIERQSMSVSQMAYCVLRRILPEVSAELKRIWKRIDEIDFDYCDKIALFDSAVDGNTEAEK